MAKRNSPARPGWSWWALFALASSLLVSLLVGWILVWAALEEGPRAVMISLGSVAFTLVLVVLAMLLGYLKRENRLRMAEARFLTGASHNLRTPLASILVAAQTLPRDGIPDEERRRLESTILREGRLLALRVDNLVETGRLELEDRALEPERVDLARIAAGAVRSVRERVEHRGGSLEARLGEAVPVQGDERLLRLLVENLIDNAIQFSPGELRVEVEAAAREGKAVLRVSDRGMGFGAEGPPPGGRFQGGDAARGGLGLGLELARAIARSHAGALALASEGPGRGATAELRLPLARDLEAGAEG